MDDGQSMNRNGTPDQRHHREKEGCSDHKVPGGDLEPLIAQPLHQAPDHEEHPQDLHTDRYQETQHRSRAMVAVNGQPQTAGIFDGRPES